MNSSEHKWYYHLIASCAIWFHLCVRIHIWDNTQLYCRKIILVCFIYTSSTVDLASCFPAQYRINIDLLKVVLIEWRLYPITHSKRCYDLREMKTMCVKIAMRTCVTSFFCLLKVFFWHQWRKSGWVNSFFFFILSSMWLLQPTLDSHNKWMTIFFNHCFQLFTNFPTRTLNLSKCVSVYENFTWEPVFFSLHKSSFISMCANKMYNIETHWKTV